MDREMIERAATESCVIDNSILNPEYVPYYEHGFKDGAQWRINAVWHDATNIPKKKGEQIVVVFRSGNLTSWNVSDDIVDVFKRFDVILWSYSKDLLPKRKEETK